MSHGDDIEIDPNSHRLAEVLDKALNKNSASSKIDDVTVDKPYLTERSLPLKVQDVNDDKYAQHL